MKRARINSLDSLRAFVTPGSRPLCLYSGGLDGSYLLYYLTRRVGCRGVTALTLDLGGDLDAVAIGSLCERLGVAWRPEVRRAEFAEQFVLPAIRAHATYLGGHPICASLSRPLMAKTACEVARELACDIILHTSTRSQNSLRRFNGALSDIAAGAEPCLGFDGTFGSPFEESSVSREQKREELEAAGIRLFHDRICSIDSNLWGREFESGPLDDPEEFAPPESMYRWTRHGRVPEPRRVSIAFRAGVPYSLDGTEVDSLELISRLNETAGAFGLGRYVGLEEVAPAVKVQEVREMPAAHVLFDVFRRIESACVSAECIREKIQIEQVWVREAVEGRWFGPLRQASQAFIDNLSSQVTGTVIYRLEPQNMHVVSLSAERPLYVRDRTQFEDGQKTA
jgi:argininosuccinate synthase